jgi:hemerythrin
LQKSEWEIAWSDSLSVGVPEMDEEHRQFIARVNELNKAIIECEDKISVGRRMKLMLTQAAEHFAHEEKLLDQSRFPQAAAHRAKHAELMAQFDRAMKEFEESDLSFIWALKGLSMKQRLVEHLLQEDMQYRDFMRVREGPEQA